MHMNSLDLEKLKEYLKEKMVKIIMSLEFARKQSFKLKKTKRLIYVRNVDGIFMSGIVHT